MTRILIADDSAEVRDALRRQLGGMPGYDVAGEVSNGRDALSHAERLRPEILLLDFHMPEADAITVTLRVQESTPRPSVLVMSLSQDRRYVLSALRAGAGGFLWKPDLPACLDDALAAVGQGVPFVSETVRSALEDADGPLSPEGAKAALALFDAHAVHLFERARAVVDADAAEAAIAEAFLTFAYVSAKLPDGIEARSWLGFFIECYVRSAGQRTQAAEGTGSRTPRPFTTGLANWWRTHFQNHPDYDDFRAFWRGRMHGPERRRFLSHLESCSLCAIECNLAGHALRPFPAAADPGAADRMARVKGVLETRFATGKVVPSILALCRHEVRARGPIAAELNLLFGDRVANRWKGLRPVSNGAGISASVLSQRFLGERAGPWMAETVRFGK